MGSPENLFTMRDVCLLARISRRQLSYWIQKGGIRPALTKKFRGPAKNVRHYFDFTNLLACRILREMVRVGFNFNQLKRLDEFLSSLPEEELQGAIVVITRRTATVVTNKDQAWDALKKQRYLFSVEGSYKELKRRIEGIKKCEEKQKARTREKVPV